MDHSRVCAREGGGGGDLLPLPLTYKRKTERLGIGESKSVEGPGSRPAICHVIMRHVLHLLPAPAAVASRHPKHGQGP